MRKEREKKEKEAKEAAKEAAKKKEKEDKKKQKELEEAAKKKEKEDKKKAKKGDLTVAVPLLDDMSRDDEDLALLSSTSESRPEVISIRNAVTEIATDYKKRKYVFRIITESKAEYLFQAADDKEMKSWVNSLVTFAKVGLFSVLFVSDTRNTELNVIFRHQKTPLSLYLLVLQTTSIIFNLVFFFFFFYFSLLSLVRQNKRSLFGRVKSKTDKKPKAKSTPSRRPSPCISWFYDNLVARNLRCGLCRSADGRGPGDSPLCREVYFGH